MFNIEDNSASCGVLQIRALSPCAGCCTRVQPSAPNSHPFKGLVVWVFVFFWFVAAHNQGSLWGNAAPWYFGKLPFGMVFFNHIFVTSFLFKRAKYLKVSVNSVFGAGRLHAPAEILPDWQSHFESKHCFSFIRLAEKALEKLDSQRRFPKCFKIADRRCPMSFLWFRFSSL